MNKFLKFENNNEERNCKLDIIIRNLEIIKIMVIFSFFKSFFFLIYYWRTISYFTIILNILDIFIMGLVQLMVINVDQIHQNDLYIRIFLEIDIWIVLISKSFFEEYTAQMLPLIFSSCAFYNIIFTIPVDLSLALYSAESAIILFTYDHEDSFFIMRFVILILKNRFII